MIGDGKKSKSDVNLNYDFYIYCDLKKKLHNLCSL